MYQIMRSDSASAEKAKNILVPPQNSKFTEIKKKVSLRAKSSGFPWHVIIVTRVE